MNNLFAFPQDKNVSLRLHISVSLVFNHNKNLFSNGK